MPGKMPGVRRLMGNIIEFKEKGIKPLEKMTDEEIIEACMSEETPAAVCMFQLAETPKGQSLERQMDQDNYIILGERSVYNALLKIEPRPSVVSIRLKFKSAVDPELKLLWNLLSKYGEKSSLLNKEEKDTFLSMAIMPNDYIGQVMITAVNPISWTLEPEIIGTPLNNMLHIDFWANAIYIIDGDDIGDTNIQEEIANIKRETERKYVTRQGDELDGE